MTFSVFVKQYFIVTFLSAVIIAVLSTQSFFTDFKTFSWISLVFFAIITLSTTWFVAGGTTKRKGDPASYLLVAITLKLLLSIVFVLIYALTVKPENKLFVVPFFVLYIIYSTMQTRFLSYWARKK